MRFSRHRGFTIRLAVELGLLLVVSQARAATFHVSPNGSNTPPYDTYATAAHAVADAVLAASGYGDTVLVHAGTYGIDTTIYIPAGLVWRGVSRDSVVFEWTDLEAESGLFMFRLEGDNEIYGMELNFPMGSSFRTICALFSFAPHSLIIKNCRFREVTNYISGSGVIEVSDNEFLYGQNDGIGIGVSAAWVHHNSFLGNYAGDAISVFWAGNVLIEHNYFNKDGYAHLSCCPTAVNIDHATSVAVRNNLMLNSREPVGWVFASGVVENNTMIVAIGLSGGPPPQRVIRGLVRSYESLTIRNNIFQEFTGHWAFGNYCDTCPKSGPILFVHNAFWPPTDTTYIYYPTIRPDSVALTDSANFNSYPMFDGDSTYELQAGSPLIDAGDPAVYDLDGTRSDIGWTGGPNGIVSAYPELPPEAPESVWVEGTTALVSVQWSSRPEADLAGYRLYRGSASGFWMPGLPPLREFPPGDTSAVDTILVADQNFYYVTTAVDTAGLESGPSPEGMYILTGIFDDPEDPVLPRTPFITRVYPNPFNSSVTLEVHIPDVGARPAPVTVTIYNLLGQVEAIAFDGRLEPGNHQITWDGCATDGSSSASGLYFARLRVWNQEFGKPKKVVLVK
jgi:hypothetical protein